MCPVADKIGRSQILNRAGGDLLQHVMHYVLVSLLVFGTYSVFQNLLYIARIGIWLGLSGIRFLEFGVLCCQSLIWSLFDLGFIGFQYPINPVSFVCSSAIWTRCIGGLFIFYAGISRMGYINIKFDATQTYNRTILFLSLHLFMTTTKIVVE
ncbi:hypothetical protein ASPZODRAFT_1743995 [Penicilliopsis zonata CBS 506.65]|uniref:Uncharacterized protein n=1 Tax=Penicilliopsis zonata CBS 506.65 TaxID=1073090 RepID=A0A1L9SKP5_9EURO|nr:hypothetical protein ASPZODRAFT_1743995 [Penicilliopsis zonata CBS 506.65]OJJ47671.1 hypothetical protein ASPZODRAFT_1743995 [Penicilliopsis zonata CBS 506.65]